MSKPNQVWIIDDDRSIRWVLEKALNQAGLETISFESGEKALTALAGAERKPRAVISDVRMPGIDGLTLLGEIHAEHPELPIVIMTAHSDLESAVSAYQGGAFEYLPKPFDVDEAVAVMQRALAHAQEQSAKHIPEIEDVDTEIIGEAPAMQEVFRLSLIHI